MKYPSRWPNSGLPLALSLHSFVIAINIDRISRLKAGAHSRIGNLIIPSHLINVDQQTPYEDPYLPYQVFATATMSPYVLAECE